MTFLDLYAALSLYSIVLACTSQRGKGEGQVWRMTFLDLYAVLSLYLLLYWLAHHKGGRGES